jgi:hypothetical protein
MSHGSGRPHAREAGSPARRATDLATASLALALVTCAGSPARLRCPEGGGRECVLGTADAQDASRAGRPVSEPAATAAVLHVAGSAPSASASATATPSMSAAAFPAPARAAEPASTATAKDDRPPSRAIDERQWAELQRRLPELREYRPADPTALSALLSWVPPHGSATLYDADCKPIRNVQRDEGDRGLVGDILESRSVSGNRKSEHWHSMSMGWGITITCGTTIESAQQPNGAWQEGSVEASGCDDEAHLQLFKVTSTIAWYSPVVYELVMERAGGMTERQICTDGQSRECVDQRYGLFPKSVVPWFGVGHAAYGMASASTTGHRVDCSTSCGSSNEAEIRAALELVRGHTFVPARSGQEGARPEIFRSLAACKAYRAAAQGPQGPTP